MPEGTQTRASLGGATRAAEGANGEWARGALLEVWGRGRISDVAWAHDSRRLFVAGAIGIVEHAADDLSQRRLLSEAADSELIAPGPDGLLIVASPQAIMRWSAGQSATASVLLYHPQPPLAVLLDPGGYIAVDNGYRLHIYRIPSGELLASLATASIGLPGSMSFSADGQRLAVIGDEAVEVWDLASKACLYQLFAGQPAIRRVAFQGATALVTAGANGIARWRAADGALLETLAEGLEDVQHLAVTPGGAVAAVTSAGVLLWPAGGSRLRLAPPLGLLRRLAFSPDEATLLAASASELHLWDAHNGIARASLCDYWDGVGDVVFAPDGRHLAALAGNGRIWSFDRPADDRVIATHWGGGRGAAAFSPDGARLALANARELRVYQVSNGVELCRWPVGVAQSGGLSFSADGTRLILVSESGVALHDAASGAPLAGFGAALAEAREVVLSPDGRALALVGDGRAQLWSIVPRALRASFAATPDCNGAALCGDGRLLAVADDEALQVWDTASGALLRGVGEGASLVALSFSGRLLAAASGRELRVYDLADGACRGRFDRHADTITSITFAPDERCIATGSRDGTVRLWRLG